MVPPGIRRPTTRWERSATWLLIGLPASVALFAGSVMGIRTLQRSGSSALASFALASGLGVIGVSASLATLFYTLRKRRLQERLPGTMMVWFKSHIYLGLIAAIAVAAHVLVLPWTDELSTGKIAALTFVALVISGIAWSVVYRQVPPKVAATVGNLSRTDMRRRQEQSRMAIDKITLGRSEQFQAAVVDLVAGKPNQELSGRVAELDSQEAAAWEQAVAEAGRLGRAVAREHKQAAYARLLQGWRVVHLPLAALFLGMVVVHVFDVSGGSKAFESEPERQFAGSDECARCHSEVVNEWKLSMHRNAQTSTITVAQTRVALAEHPEFGKACVNCHAPVASKFSENTVFPLLQSDPGDDPDSVADEGITCVVCHSMARHPPELAGFGDLPLGNRSATSYGDFFGPPLQNPPPIPSSAHSSAVGFMTDPAASSQLCGACHNVKVDLNGNGLIASEFAESARLPVPNDTDGDGILDSNELDLVDGQLQDLVLQTTFDEWENYLASLAAQGTTGLACIDCHMPRRDTGPIVDNVPLLASSADRARRAHSFVGVDYDLNAGYYNKEGMPRDAMRRVLEEREKLLASAAKMEVEVGIPDRRGRTEATVAIQNLTGHDLPTGFAFARQFFLEVSAKTASGRPICLAPDPHGIPSPCASGRIDEPDQELATCDPAIVGEGNADIRFVVLSPRLGCDPWLTNYQKVLTDGDPDGDGIFTEVAYQSKLPDIVKLRVRTADQQTMTPLKPGETGSFDYVFDASPAGGEPIQVRAVLRLRHVPPSLVRALDGSYSSGLSSRTLLRNMTVVDVASNEELGETRTTPSPAEVGSKTVAQARKSLVSLAADELPIEGVGPSPQPVEPAFPGIALSTESSDLGDALVGTSGGTATVTVTSTGDAALKIDGVALVGANPGDFALIDDGCSGQTLAPGATCTLRVRFSPNAAGNRSARISISTNAAGSPQGLNFTGTGTQPAPGAPAAGLGPDPVDFGEVPVSTTSGVIPLRVSSVGTAPLIIQGIVIGGANPRDFPVADDGCSGRTLPPGSSCTVDLRFTPMAVGARSARLALTSNAPGGPQAARAGFAIAVNAPGPPAVLLTGTGVGAASFKAPGPSPSPGEATSPGIVVAPHPVDFGSVSVGTTTASRTITATSNGSAVLKIASVSLGGANPGEFSLSSDGCSGQSLPPGASCTVLVSFAPSSTRTHAAQAVFKTNVSSTDLRVDLKGAATDPDASLELAGPSSEPGGVITAGGKGCTPNAPVQLFVDGLEVLGQLNARADGTFRALIDLPDNLGVGRRRVQADCGVILEGTLDLVSSTQSNTPAGPLGGTLLVVMFFLLRAQSLGKGRQVVRH